jgi:hypothetical protein
MHRSDTPWTRPIRFATTVARCHTTLVYLAGAALTWAGLPPAGSHQLAAGAPFSQPKSPPSSADKGRICKHLILVGGAAH